MQKQINLKNKNTGSQSIRKKMVFPASEKKHYQEVLRKVLDIKGVIKLLDIMEKHGFDSTLGSELISIRKKITEK